MKTKFVLVVLLVAALALMLGVSTALADPSPPNGSLTLVDEAGNPLANYPADYPAETRNLKYKYRCGGDWAPEMSFQTDPNGEFPYNADCSAYSGQWDNKITVTLNQTSVEQDVTVKSTFQAAKVNANLKSCTGPITDVPGGAVDQGGGYWYHHGDTGPAGTVSFYTFPGSIKVRMGYNHNNEERVPVAIVAGANNIDFQTTNLTINYADDIRSNKGGSWWMFSKPSMDLLPGEYPFYFKIGSTWDGPVTISVSGCEVIYPPSTNERGSLTLVDEAGNPLANYPADYPAETRNLKYKYRCGGDWAPEMSFQTDANGEFPYNADCSAYSGQWDNKITVTLNQTSVEQDVTVKSTFQAAKVNANLKSCTGPITDVPGGAVDQGGGYWYHHGDTGPAGTVSFYTFPGSIKVRMGYNHNNEERVPVAIVAGANNIDFQTTNLTINYADDIRSNKGGSWWMFSKPSMDLLPGEYPFYFKIGSTWDGPVMISVSGCEVIYLPPSTNEPPTVLSAAADAFGNEGSLLTTLGSFTDPDSDALTITGSGAGSVTDNGDGTWSWSYTPADNGTGTVIVTADDGKGGTATDSFDWTAYNVAPVVTLSGVGTASEGQTKSYTFTTVDPGAEAFTQDSVTCGTGGNLSNSVFIPTTGSGSFDCAFPDGPATPEVKMCLNDGDGGDDCDAIKVMVSNVAPSATFNTPASVPEGSIFGLSLTGAADPSSDDTSAGFTYAFDCGGGYRAFGPSNTATCTAGLAGTLTVKGQVRDKDGGASEYTANIAVLGSNQVKEKLRIIVMLQRLLPTRDWKTDRQVGTAICHILRSLGADLWKDGSHLTKKGQKVFDEEKMAVEALQQVKRSFAGAVAPAINALVSVDAQLAQTAINEASPGKNLDRANEQKAKALEEIAKGNPAKAIEHYKYAWQFATKN